MGTNERREREKLELRTKILDAARELFVHEGYEAVTMRRIAERIEYSPTAIYLHFKDKDALLRELCEGDFLQLAQELSQRELPEDPLARLRGAALGYVEFARRYPNHYRMMFMTPVPWGDHDEELVKERRGNPEMDAYAFMRWNVAEAHEQGLFRPELQDVDLIVQTLWAGIHGVLALHIAKECDQWVDWRPFEARVELMLDTLMHGMTRGEE